MGPKLDEQVCYSLYSTSRAITKAYKPLLEPLKLTYPQYVVMMALWDKDSVSINDISQMTLIGNATLTSMLKRLEKIGYIERNEHSTDERQKKINLTKSGKKIAENSKTASEIALCATGLNENEVIELMRICELIKTNLN